MWGGRFERGPDASFYEFERSWQFDRRLLPQELALDRAWARAIAAAGILTDDEARQIVAALDEIEVRAKTDSVWLDGSKAEDVHHFAETALIEKLGSLGAKLHTGRSRNEMVATEFRMYVKDAARGIGRAIGALASAIASQAGKIFRVPMPGTTHMQHAQPLLLSHWLLAHGEAFLRDAERIAGAAARADLCPLGSGALAGCAFPLDRKTLARDLGFAGITANSLDAVSDRDFALEFLFALTTLAMHLSRLAEDMVLFATPEFGFVQLPDEFSTGSSLMPQKKNPDAWELIRGKTGRIYGALFALLTTCKGLPSSYQRDLQEDKEALFDAHDQALATVQIAAATLAATTIQRSAIAGSLSGSRTCCNRTGGLSRRVWRAISRSARSGGQGAARGRAGREIDSRDADRAAKGIFSRVRARSGHGTHVGIGARTASGSRRNSAGSGSQRRWKNSRRGSRSSRRRYEGAASESCRTRVRFSRWSAQYAVQGLLLPRAEEEIRRNISHFLVQEEKKRVVSCVALESYGADLAEIRSLAVQPEMRGRGAGAKLLRVRAGRSAAARHRTRFRGDACAGLFCAPGICVHIAPGSH